MTAIFAKICQERFYVFWFLPFLSHLTLKRHQNSYLTWSAHIIWGWSLFSMLWVFKVTSTASNLSFKYFFLANTTFPTTLTLSDHSNFVKSRRRPIEQSLFLFRRVMEDAVRDTNSMMTALVQESFPEVKIWNSHLYSDRLRKWVCDECKEDYLWVHWFLADK